jgi:hypothetical protein
MAGRGLHPDSLGNGTAGFRGVEMKRNRGSAIEEERGKIVIPPLGFGWMLCVCVSVCVRARVCGVAKRGETLRCILVKELAGCCIWRSGGPSSKRRRTVGTI